MERIDREDLKKIQLERLKKTVERCYHNVPFYKERLDSVGMTPEKFTSLDDLKEIPFTTKADIRDHYPYGLFAAPMKEIVRLHASSGTTGKPTVVGYTRNDLNMWAEAMARLLVAAGLTDEDIVQVSFGYGLFTGAFGLHYGIENVGATVVPTSSGNTEKQIMLMKDFGTTALVGTPSYAIHMAEVAEQMGIKKEDLKLRLGFFGAEASTEEMRAELEKRWGILATENYGMSELVGPGVAGECIYKKGMHINEELFIPEIIDPATGEVLPYGEKGEVVVTTICKEGIPLLRYRTKDITYIIDEPCECGRTTLRFHKMQGRSDDMLIIKGVNVFPSQIESAITGTSGISPHYQLIVTKEGYFDALEVVLELVDGSLLNNYKELVALERSIKHKIRTVVGIDVKIKLVNPNTIERSQGKAKRVVDLRNQ
ncbi:phenylacetate--CoA ligase family protein [Acetivibrio sp. MSJd-27]|uniref:phenylacetate--CoA ligase family protein n=1 Tax=Acetivibrio sp. MSJd-27 TaxID=2841523 RepID=UPI001C105A7C|nr:phenylacetate--CoA ligase [Acetivibrio sp. MSJd-27]MBU5448991.1 phenylacetate--CoA ligase [Acetivibrio sp. MSJd-27]